MEIAFLIGRIVYGGYFFYSGINHFMNTSMMAGYAGSKGVPAPKLAVMGSGLMILVGGFFIATGLLPHIGALLIVVFLLVVSPMMHNFWAIADPAQKMNDMVNFTKNMALAGAALMLLIIPEPWPYSL